VANEEHLVVLQQGVGFWNDWRNKNPETRPDLSNANLSRVALKGIDLSRANCRGIQLAETDLTLAWLREADLIEANLCKANLTNAGLEYAELSGANLREAILYQAVLTRADFREADLTDANLTEAILSAAYLVRANLTRTNLRGAYLVKTLLFGADLTGANLTDVCLEDWSINSDTNLNYIECECCYKKVCFGDDDSIEKLERRPSDPNRNFEPGEFTKLFQKALSTVDLIFTDGIDWKAFFQSFQELQQQYGSENLSVQAIEKKSGEAFVIRLEVSAEIDKARIERKAMEEYETRLQLLEVQYYTQLQAKDREIEIYRQQSTDFMEIARLMASRPINVEATATAESGAMTRNINTGGGSYYETINTGGGNYIQGNYIAMSQDLTQAAGQIQELLNQLQKSGVTVEVAQEQVATDLAKQAKSNPTVMGKLVGWGQTMANKASETTISEAAKAIVPLALKLVGIPLP